jgi:CheY-like chemotaxis protein
MPGKAPILIVEDNADSADVLRRILVLRRYHVVVARDGQEALDQLRGGLRPGVIVLDVWMPNMDGRAFRAAQLADPELAGIPVIAYSVDPGALPAVIGQVRKGVDSPDRLLDLIDSTYRPG